jgi:4'-phosphopantetheinyl transferase
MELRVEISVHTVESALAPDPLQRTLWNLLDAGERERAERFVYERHRRQHVVAHALKRAVIAGMTGVAPSLCRFTTLTHGKPVLVHPTGLHFSLSHADGLVALATSPDGPLGIDVEPTHREAPLEVAEAVFAPEERDWLAGGGASACDDRFFRLWTLKEAYLKATGRGLSEPLDGFAISFEPPRLARAGAGPDAWHFAERLVAGHHLALAWRGSPARRLTFRHVSPEDIGGLARRPSSPGAAASRPRRGASARPGSPAPSAGKPAATTAPSSTSVCPGSSPNSA